MNYLYIKALHIIFIVTWFAGMFYIVRLFIYCEEARHKDASIKQALLDQLLLMSRRLWYGITIPSALLTLFFGPYVMYQMGYFHPDTWSHLGWLHIKLVFVVLLYIYFISLHIIFRQQQKGTFKYSSQFLRIWNEVATIFLVAIVMLATVKDSMSWAWGLVGLALFIVLLMSAIKLYKIIRKRNE